MQNRHNKVNMKILKVQKVRTCPLLITPAINVVGTPYGNIIFIFIFIFIFIYNTHECNDFLMGLSFIALGTGVAYISGGYENFSKDNWRHETSRIDGRLRGIDI